MWKCDFEIGYAQFICVSFFLHTQFQYDFWCYCSVYLIRFYIDLCLLPSPPRSSSADCVQQQFNSTSYRFHLHVSPIIISRWEKVQMNFLITHCLNFVEYMNKRLLTIQLVVCSRWMLSARWKSYTEYGFAWNSSKHELQPLNSTLGVLCFCCTRCKSVKI